MSPEDSLDVECTCAYVPFGDPRYRLQQRMPDPECPEHSMQDDDADAQYDVARERDW